MITIPKVASAKQKKKYHAGAEVVSVGNAQPSIYILFV